MLYAQHRAVCSSMLTKPLLPSQVCMHAACGAALACSGAALCRVCGAKQAKPPVLVWGLGEMHACMHASPYAHQRACNQPPHPHALTLSFPTAIS